MVGQAIGDVLPGAIGVALSPIPIVAVILMLFGSRARSNGPAFVAGWVLGLSVVGAIVLALAAAGDLTANESGESDASSIIKLVVGIALVLLAGRNWRKRPRKGDEPEVPRFISGIDSFTVPRSFGLAFLLSAINPKNLALALAASLTIAQA
ncbi:MAG: GAP family protein, partial [Gaiellales bacterium]